MQRARSFWFLVFLGSCGLLASPVAGAEQKGTPADAVRATIEADGTAQVVVTLVSPARV